jgi:hypothetical protein
MARASFCCFEGKDVGVSAMGALPGGKEKLVCLLPPSCSTIKDTRLVDVLRFCKDNRNKLSAYPAKWT